MGWSSPGGCRPPSRRGLVGLRPTREPSTYNRSVTLSPGSRLGPYTILAPLGAGGMGEVWEARDPRLKRRVALKVLPEDLASHRERLARFQREAEALAALNHPNVVTIHSVEEAEGVHFLTMERVEGRPLDALVPKRGMELKRFLELAIQLTGGLAAAHEKNITHRDLKPANLMVDDEGRLKVLDFGLAKWQDPAGPALTNEQTETMALTREGTVLGTLPYMSPEQLEGRAVDHRSDIFSLGVVLHECLTGGRPFVGPSPASVASSILESAPTPVDEIRSDLPHHLGRVVRRCLAKDPRDRYQTVRDVHNELKGLKEEILAGATAAADTLHATASRSPSRRWATVLLVAGAVSLATLLGWWLVERGKPGSGPASSETVERPGIAVLPLTDLSGEPGREFFADGMTEALITDLAKVEGLKVISRGSVIRFKETERPIPEIARALDVDYVLEGSVLRSGDRARITAQLIRADDDSHVWAESYEESLEDILSLQNRVAHAVAREVAVALSPREEDRLTERQTRVHPEAYEQHLKGRHFLARRTEQDLRQGLGHFQRALEIDPDFASAWAGVADSYFLLADYGGVTPEQALQEGRPAALKALELDEDHAEALTSLAEMTFFLSWDPVTAERYFRRAIASNPGYSTAHQWYSELLMLQGDSARAIDEARKALELDPLSGIVQYQLAISFYFARRYESCLESLRSASEINPDYWLHRLVTASCLDESGRPKEALEHAHRAVELSDREPWALSVLGYTAARAGRREEAKELLEELERIRETKYISPVMVAWLRLSLGDREGAIRELEQALAERDIWMMAVPRYPPFDPLQDAPQFREIVRRLDLPREASRVASPVS